MERCPECGGRILISSDGVPVCSNCGLVQPNYLPVYESRISPIAEKYITTSSIRSNSGSLILLRDAERLGRGWKKLCRINESVRLARLSAQKDAMSSFEQVCNDLNLPSYIRLHALLIYKRAIKVISERRHQLLGNKRINHYRILAASIILAARQNYYPLKQKDVLRAFQKRGHRVFSSNVMEAMWIMKKTNIIRIKPEGKISDIAIKYAKILIKNSKIPLDLKRKIEEATKAIIIDTYQKVDSNIVQGRNPHIVAAALAYLSIKRAATKLSLESKCRSISLARTAALTGFSLSAIRTNVSLLKHYV